MTNSIVLFSGGLDSFISTRLNLSHKPVYVGYDHNYQGVELAAVRAQNFGVTEVTGPPLGKLEEDDGHIAARNINLISTAVAFTGASEVIFTALAGETSGDKSGRFFRLLSKALSVSEKRRIRVLAPYRHLTKTQLVRRYLAQGGTANYLRGTSSCYNAEYLGDRCGECMACFRRWVALSLNGIHETYANPPWRMYEESDLIAAFKKYMLTSHVSEWLGIARNNWDAYRAIRQSW